MLIRPYWKQLFCWDILHWVELECGLTILIPGSLKMNAMMIAFVQMVAMHSPPFVEINSGANIELISRNAVDKVDARFHFPRFQSTFL